MKLFLLIVCCAVPVLTSCRTNDIAHYTLTDSTVLYRTTTASDAAEAHMHITSPSHDPISSIFTDIGAGIAGEEVQKKLRKAINPDSLAAGLTAGVEQAMTTYFSTRTVASPSDKPAYIVEVELTDYELHSSQYGVYAKVGGSTRILQGGTAKLIWEDCESVDVPLRRASGAGWMGGPAGTAVSIFNANELLNMSDEELRAMMQQAAAEAGRDLGDQLREDVAGD